MSRKAAIRCDCPIYCKFCGAKLRRDYVGIFFLFSSLPLWLSSSFAVEIMPNGVARHEDSCPAFLFKKWKDSLESSAKGGKKR